MFPRVFDWNGDGVPDLIWGLADGTLQVTLNENTAGAPDYCGEVILFDGATSLAIIREGSKVMA